MKKKTIILEYKMVAVIGQVLESIGYFRSQEQGLKGGLLYHHPSFVEDEVFWQNLFYNLSFCITKL